MHGIEQVEGWHTSNRHITTGSLFLLGEMAFQIASWVSMHAHPGLVQTLDGRRGSHLPIDAVGAVLTPQLWKVLQAMPPVLAATRIELLIRILARLKKVQVFLKPMHQALKRD